MYPPLSFAPLKAILLATAEHITFAEIGVFMLFFLVFVFCFFLSLIFWHFKRILFIFFLIETGILLCIPYSISKISEKIIYPIEVHYETFRPFVYTTGFNYDIEITNKAKLPLKECLLTIVPKRAGTNILPKPKKIAQAEQTDIDTEPSAQSNETQASQAESNKNNKENNADSSDSNEATANQTKSSEQESNQIEQSNIANDSKEDFSTAQIANTQEANTKQNEQQTNTQPTDEAQKLAQTDQTISSDTQESKDKQEPKPKKTKNPKPPSPYMLKLYKILDYIVPLDAFVEVLELDSPLKYNKKVRWQGIIRDYKYDENFSAQISCH